MSDSWHANVKNKNRQKIIEVARELFLKRNFVSVNVKDVCLEAEISRITFYKNFKSIDELIFEVQMDILNNMTEFIIQREREDLGGEERLKGILNAFVEFAKEFKEHMKFIILFDLYYENCASSEELKTKYENFVSKENNKDFLYSTIIKGIEDKSFRSDLEPLKTCHFIFQTIMGVLQRISYTKAPSGYGSVEYEDITQAVIDMIMNSIKK